MAAIALGATVIEKHLTLRREDGGPDAGFSMEPAEFKEMVDAVRTVETALNQGVVKGPGQAEIGNVQFRKSIFFAKDLPKGHQLSAEDIRVVRPGYGLPPRQFESIIGTSLQHDVTSRQPRNPGCNQLSVMLWPCRSFRPISFNLIPLLHR